MKNEVKIHDYILKIASRKGYIKWSFDQKEFKDGIIKKDLEKSIKNNNDGISDGEVNKIVHDLLSDCGNNSEINHSYLKYKELFWMPRIYINKKTNEKHDLRILDLNNPDNNIFKVVKSVWIGKSGKREREIDVSLYINGIPLVIFEAKTFDNNKEGKANNQLSSLCKKLHNLVQIAIIVTNSNRNSLIYNTANCMTNQYNVWRQVDNSLNRKDFNWEESIKSFFNEILDKPKILNFIKFYIIYEGKNVNSSDKDSIKICRYYQYRAVEASVRRLMDKNFKTGIVWHTQGSGKTLTQTLILRKMINIKNNTRFLLVGDRTNLKDQMKNNLHRMINDKSKIKDINRRNELLAALKNKMIKIIISTQQKFLKDIESELSQKELDKFVIFIDEAHRSQYGEMFRKLKKVFPNSQIIAFTGTPVETKERSTKNKFTEFIDIYTLGDAAKDNIIIETHYQCYKYKISGSVDISDMEQPLVEKREEVEKKYKSIPKDSIINKFNNTTELELNNHPNIKESEISTKANEIFKMISKITAEEVKKTKWVSLLTCKSRKEVLMYWEYFCKNYTELNAKAIISESQEYENEETKNTFNNLYKRWYNQTLKLDSKYVYKTTQIDVIPSDKNINQVKLLIVCRQLTTGYDNKYLKILFVDRPMKDAELLQTFARVNRYAENKDSGHIFDFCDLLNNFENAKKKYAKMASDNIENMSYNPNEIVNITTRIDPITAELKDTNGNILKILEQNGFSDTSDRDKITSFFIKSNNSVSCYNFMKYLDKYLKCVRKINSYYSGATWFNNNELYINNMKNYLKIRKSIRLMKSPDIETDSFVNPIINIINKYIKNTKFESKVLFTTEKRDIFSSEFYSEFASSTSSKKHDIHELNNKELNTQELSTQKQDSLEKDIELFSAVRETVEDKNNKIHNYPSNVKSINKILKEFEERFEGPNNDAIVSFESEKCIKLSEDNIFSRLKDAYINVFLETKKPYDPAHEINKLLKDFYRENKSMIKLNGQSIHSDEWFTSSSNKLFNSMVLANNNSIYINETPGESVKSACGNEFETITNNDFAVSNIREIFKEFRKKIINIFNTYNGNLNISVIEKKGIIQQHIF